MINYANSVDCYQIWADMVCYDEVRNAELERPEIFLCLRRPPRLP